MTPTLLFTEVNNQPVGFALGLPDINQASATPTADVTHGYRWMDMSLTAEDNLMTTRIATRFGAEVYNLNAHSKPSERFMSIMGTGSTGNGTSHQSTTFIA